MSWGNYYHKEQNANAFGWQSGPINYFGCTLTPTGKKDYGGIRWLKIRANGCPGTGDGLIIKEGHAKELKPTWAINQKTHPYIAFLNGGNKYSDTERIRYSKIDVPLCWQGQSKIVDEAFTGMVNAMKSDPVVNSKCGPGKAHANRFTAATNNKKCLQNGCENNCMTARQTWARVFEFSCKYVPSSEQDCNDYVNKKSHNGKFCSSARVCNSNHAPGRAWDIFDAGVTSRWYPDPYYLPNWTGPGRCAFTSWMWMANNAHRWNVSNISNEYWHWQYNYKIEDKDDIAKISAMKTPEQNVPEESQQTDTKPTDPKIVEENKTENVQITDGSPNISFEPEDEMYAADEPTVEQQYNSLEAVSQVLDIERAPVGGLLGLKYYSTEASDLLIIDRVNNANRTKTNPEIESSFGSNENNVNQVKENLKDNSPWNSAPPIQENEKIKSLSTKLDSLKNKQVSIDQTVQQLTPILNEYYGILNNVEQDEVDEALTQQFYDKIQNNLKNNSGSPVLETVNKILGEKSISGKDKIDQLQDVINQSETESLNISNEISSMEKELQILTKDAELSRKSVESRISNFVNPLSSNKTLGIPNNQNLLESGLSSVIGSGSLSNLKEFDLYETGDKLEKLDVKLKKLTLPKLPDIQTLLAGGISSKNFLSSLSSFSLPGLEELDGLKEIASQAQDLYNGDLSVIEQYAGDLGAIDAVNSWQLLKDAQKTLGPIVEEGKKIYDSGSKLYEEGQKYYKSASNAYTQYEKLKKEGEELWKEGGRLWNETKSEYDNLKKQSAKLWEEIKDLPEQAKSAAIAEYNKLESQAEKKLKDLKSKGQDQIDNAKNEWIKLKTEGETLVNQGKSLLGNPKVTAANEAQSKIDEATQSVEEIKNTFPPEALERIESAANKKEIFEAALNKAAIAEKSLLESKNRSNTDKTPKKHFPKNFKSFSDWVLEKENEVRNVEFTPQLLLDIQMGNVSQMETNLGLSPTNQDEISVRLDGQPSLSPTSQNTPELLDNSSSQSEPFIIYRGITGKINNPTVQQIEGGKYTNFGYERIPTQFKSYFDFGKSESNPVNLSKLFDGYTRSIMSPIDVGLLLNPGNVGMFNNIAPYGFGEGSELAAAVTFQKVVQRDIGVLFSKGGAGTRKQPNWAYNPEWAGLYINFLMEENGIYQSDDDFLDFRRLVRVQEYVKNGKGIKLKNTAPLTEIPKSFPGAVICYFDQSTRKGHAEILLRVTLGGFITLGGNIKIEGVSKFSSTHGFRTYYSLKDFSQSNDVYIIERGKKNPWTTNGRLDGRIKRTDILNEYMSSIENSDSPKNSKLFSEAYNILRGNISDTVFSRSEMSTLTDNFKVSLKDESFTIHKYNDIYLSGSVDLNEYITQNIYILPSEESGGH